jgi:hypothetical protein
MTEQNDFEQEELEDQVDSQDGDNQEEQEENPLNQRLDQLESMIRSLASSNAPRNEEPKKERTALTKEQLATLRDNPELLLNFIEEKTNNAVQGVSQKVETQRWDEKAEKDFPALRSDKKFQELVTKKIQELVSFGRVPKDSPTLLYTAAELASAKYQPKSQEQARKQDTSALRPNGKKPNTAPTDKLKAEFEQKTYLLKAAGYPEDKIKKMLERYEATGTERVSRSGLRRRMTQL